jgi:hypothetical protein
MLVNPNGLMFDVLTVRFHANKQAQIFALEETE